MSKAIQFKNKTGENIYPCPYYPIGSIYMSVSSTDPGTIFGGKWERIKGRFLLSADDNTYKINATGGEATHKLTTSEMPSHTHNLTHGTFTIANGYGSGVSGIPCGQSGWGSYGNAHWFEIASTGGSGAHNNMPPYFVVYMWKRVS